MHKVEGAVPIQNGPNQEHKAKVNDNNQEQTG
jgi:hypothetical protein